MTVSKKWLTNIDLDKIKAECEDECCNPPGSSAKATSSAIFGAVNTAIPEATTEHSEILRLLILDNENSKSGEAATEHSEIPEAACQEAKRPKKSRKGSSSILANENSQNGEAATEHSLAVRSHQHRSYYQ